MNTYKNIRKELLDSDLRSVKKKRLVMILDGINSFINEHNRAYVDQANLAACCGCGLTQVKKATRELQELGYLHVVRTTRLTDKKYHWNEYQLVYPPVVADSEATVANRVGENGWIHNPTWEYLKPLLAPGSIHVHERHGSMEIVTANNQQIVFFDAGSINQTETPQEFLGGYGMPAEQIRE